MALDPLDEFQTLREAVHEGLRAGRFVGRDTGWPLCRFLTIPSFEDAVGWDVLSLSVRGEPARPRLFRSWWRMDRDLQVLGSPVERLKHPRPYRPTVEVSSASIDAASIEGLIRRFQTIPVPLAVAEPTSGLDGTSYELEIGDPFRNARIAWWERLPQEWQALGPLVEEMRGLFESSWRDAWP